MSALQSWDPASYARNARFVSDLGSAAIELLAPRPGERILTSVAETAHSRKNWPISAVKLLPSIRALRRLRRLGNLG